MKILVSDPITDAGLNILKSGGFDVLYLPEATASEKAEAGVDVQGWIIRSGTRISGEMIESAKNLQVIGRAGVGVDNIDITAATRKGVVVMNTPDVNTISAAEHTLGLILALSRNIPSGHRGLMNGEWNRNALVGSELRNKTLGIIGMGKIGREVLQRCRSFGMNILGYDPYLGQEMFNPEEVKIVELDDLTRNSDYISLHVPLTDNTRDLFDYHRLSMMKRGARIINVARGGIVNENDLAKALDEGLIDGAAIDVFSDEPINKNHPLVSARNIVLTPHLGASTQEAKEGVSRSICEQVRDYLLHQKLANAINMPIKDLAKLNEIQPHLDLAETMGKIQSQLSEGSIRSLHVECAGTIEEAKPIALAFIKGMLQDRIPERINYINAESLAVERGIRVEHSYTSDSGVYTNLMRTRVTSKCGEKILQGSIFEGNQPRLVNILGFEMDITPKGTMLFAHNKDVPGVIGRVGTLLGEAKINIGAYILSRQSEDGEAFAVIRVDSSLSDGILNSLNALPEILDVRQLKT